MKELLWFFLQVIAALLQTMEDQNFPRVQAHAAAALINFTEDCPKSILIPYLDNLLQHLHVIMVGKLNEVKACSPGFDASARSSAPFMGSFLLQLIQKGNKLVLEQVVTSIASVADTAEEKFVPYYDLFMPPLKHIVENAMQKELRLLRGKTIECISLIGLAVGKEKVGFSWEGGDGSRSSAPPPHSAFSSGPVHARRVRRHAAAPQDPDGLQRPGGRRPSGRRSLTRSYSGV